MPLRHTRVIPPGWRERHEPTVRGGMTGRVRLSHPGGLGERDDDTGKTPELPPTRYYEGEARVQARGGATPAGSTADREVTTGPYLVAVPVDLAGETPQLGDLVDVLEADDPMLAGLRLYVDELPTATILLQRNLICTLQQRTLPGG